jgi:hypothetical protein
MTTIQSAVYYESDGSEWRWEVILELEESVEVLSYGVADTEAEAFAAVVDVRTKWKEYSSDEL